MKIPTHLQLTLHRALTEYRTSLILDIESDYGDELTFKYAKRLQENKRLLSLSWDTFTPEMKKEWAGE